MNSQIVDVSTWSRGDLFQFYIRQMRIVMSLTVDVDVTPLVAFARERGLKFYPLMIWTVSKVVNAHDEFKYGWDADGNLIRWDFVSPSYADFHPEDENFTKLVTPYTEDCLEFHTRFLEDRERYRDARGFVDRQIPNFFDVSCLPWVRYRPRVRRGEVPGPRDHLGKVRGGAGAAGDAPDPEHPPRRGGRVPPVPVLPGGAGADRFPGLTSTSNPAERQSRCGFAAPSLSLRRSESRPMLCQAKSSRTSAGLLQHI